MRWYVAVWYCTVSAVVWSLTVCPILIDLWGILTIWDLPKLIWYSRSLPVVQGYLFNHGNSTWLYSTILYMCTYSMNYVISASQQMLSITSWCFPFLITKQESRLLMSELWTISYSAIILFRHYYNNCNTILSRALFQYLFQVIYCNSIKLWLQMRLWLLYSSYSTSAS